MDNWIEPYKNNRTTKRFVYRKPGVYLIREKRSKKIVYVGMSKSCVYKALFRHFQTWTDWRIQRIVYKNRDNYQIRTIICDPLTAQNLEKRLIQLFKPRDNRMCYENYDYPEEKVDYSDEIYEPLETVPF